MPAGLLLQIDLSELSDPLGRANVWNLSRDRKIAGAGKRCKKKGANMAIMRERGFRGYHEFTGSGWSSKGMTFG